MNHIYRVIFNHALGVWQCVSEFAKARGKTSNKAVLAPLAVAVALASSPAMAKELIINSDEYHSGSTTYKHNDDNILVASEYGTQATVTFSNGATGAMTAKGDHAKDNYKFISIGHQGKGTLNIDNATVQSADSMILGEYSRIDTNVSPDREYANGTVNLSNKANLAVNDYLIVGDGGNGTLNVNTSSLVVAKEIIIGGGEDSTGVINIDGNKFAQGENKTTVHADDKVVIGASGQGTVNVSHDGILSAGKIVVGDEGSAVLNVTKGGNVIANNIIREHTAQSATVLLDSADIKVERGNQNNFFAGFTTNDRIEMGDGGLEFNTNGYDVTINPNAIIRNVSTKSADEQIGFVKRGKGTLTMHLDTVDIGQVLTINDGVVKIIGQEYAMDGEELRIRLNDANNYGQLHWEGKLDVSKGKLSVQASDIVRDLIGNKTTTQWNDVVKATTLSGQFGLFDVVDNNGTALNNTGINPVYSGNSVHLKLDGTSPTTPVTPPTTPVTPPTTPTGKSTGIITSNQGTQTLTGNYTMQQGDEFRIRLNNATDYGKIVVNGNLDVTKGHLSIQALDVVRQLIDNKIATQWNDVVKASTLNGEFGLFDVVDNTGTTLKNTGINPVYSGNSVHLKLDGTSPTTPVTPPTTPVTPPTTPVTPPTTPVTPPTTPVTPPTTPVTPPTTPVTPPTTPVTPPTTPVTPPTTPVTPPITPVTPPTTPVTPPTTPVTPPTTPVNGLFTQATSQQHKTSALPLAQALDTIAQANSPMATVLNNIIIPNANSAEQQTEIVGQLQPAIQAQANQIVQEQHNLATVAVADRIFQNRGDITQGSDSGEHNSLFKRSQDLNNQVWLQAVGKQHTADETTQFAGYDGHSYGLVVGADGLVSDNLRLGVALGYSDSDIDSKGTTNKQNLQSDLVQGFVYADYAVNDQTHLNGFVGYGRANVDTQRDINVINVVDGQLTANYDSAITQAGVGVDYRIGSANRHISPYTQLRYTRVANDAYSETSNDSAVTAFGTNVAKQDNEVLRATMGVHFAQPLANNVQLIGNLAGHTEQGDSSSITASFNGLPTVTFAETAQEKDKYSGSVGLGLRVQPTVNTEVSGQYQGEFSKNAEHHGGALLFKWKF